MNRNERIIKLLKVLALISLCIIVFLTAFVLGKSQICNALETPLTIKECEDAIKINCVKIEQCESIKNQLHITAQTIRQQENYDKDFVQSLSDKWFAQNDYQNNLKDDNEKLYSMIEKLKLSRKKIYR